MAGAIVTEEVANPIDGPGYWVAWLVLVDGGEDLGSLAIPAHTNKQTNTKKK